MSRIKCIMDKSVDSFLNKLFCKLFTGFDIQSHEIIKNKSLKTILVTNSMGLEPVKGVKNEDFFGWTIF